MFFVAVSIIHYPGISDLPILPFKGLRIIEKSILFSSNVRSLFNVLGNYVLRVAQNIVDVKIRSNNTLNVFIGATVMDFWYAMPPIGRELFMEVIA